MVGAGFYMSIGATAIRMRRACVLRRLENRDDVFAEIVVDLLKRQPFIAKWATLSVVAVGNTSITRVALAYTNSASV
jgi:hypothetical protein